MWCIQNAPFIDKACKTNVETWLPNMKTSFETWLPNKVACNFWKKMLDSLYIFIFLFFIYNFLKPRFF